MTPQESDLQDKNWCDKNRCAILFVYFLHILQTRRSKNNQTTAKEHGVRLLLQSLLPYADRYVPGVYQVWRHGLPVGLWIAWDTIDYVKWRRRGSKCKSDDSCDLWATNIWKKKDNNPTAWPFPKVPWLQSIWTMKKMHHAETTAMNKECKKSCCAMPTITRQRTIGKKTSSLRTRI